MIKHFDLLPFLCILTFLGTLNQNLTTQQPCRNSTFCLVHSVLRTPTRTHAISTHGTTKQQGFRRISRTRAAQYTDDAVATVNLALCGDRSISQRLFSEKVPSPKARTPRRKKEAALYCDAIYFRPLKKVDRAYCGVKGKIKKRPVRIRMKEERNKPFFFGWPGPQQGMQ